MIRKLTVMMLITGLALAIRGFADAPDKLTDAGHINQQEADTTQFQARSPRVEPGQLFRLEPVLNRDQFPLLLYKDAFLADTGDTIHEWQGSLAAAAEDIGHYYENTPRQRLTLEQTIEIVLNQNSMIHTYYTELVSASIRAKQALTVFSPMMRFSVTPNFYVSQDRVAIIRSKIPTSYDNANPTPVDISMPNGGRGLIWVPEPLEFELGDWPVHASSEYHNYTVETNINLSKQLAWGPRLDMFKLQGLYWIKPYDRLPYTMNLSTGFYLPLLKNFGNFGTYEAVEAKVRQMEVNSAYWRFQTVLNNVIRQTIMSYWDLVLSYEQYQYAATEREITESIMADLRRLVELNRYDVLSYNQMKSQFFQKKQAEVQALVSFLQITSNFSQHLGMSEEVIMIPGEDLSSIQAMTEAIPKGQSLDLFISEALQNRPELYISAYDEKMAEIQRKFADNQAKHDISLYGSVNFYEQGPYGYKDPYHAFKGVFNPDALFLSLGLSYIMPWQNQEAKYNLQLARLNEKTTIFNHDQQIRAIKSEVTNAWLQLSSSEAQIAYTTEAFMLSREIFQDIETLRESGRVSLTEYKQRQIDLYYSELSYTESLIYYLQAQAFLLGMKGSLPDRYNEWQQWEGLPESYRLELKDNRVYPTGYFPYEKDE